MGTATTSGDGTGLEAGSSGYDAWQNLIRSNAELMAQLDHELRERHDFTLGEFDVLINLSRAPGQRLRMCDLAAAVVLSASGLSRRVDRLERAGLVHRERAANDARSIEAALTPAGKRFLRKVRATHLAGVKERFVDRFDERELATLRDLLGRLRSPLAPARDARGD